jgi:hypothetical protein
MDDAVVGIIATFLITGLIVIVISLIQTIYIPKWMEQNEADHMENVCDQFAQLKFAIDSQTVLGKQQELEIPMPISTSITLGNKEMPFLMSSRSYGSLEIIPEECVVKIIEDTGPAPEYKLGIIKYSSVNSYFLNQDYIYEAGALILSQSEGNTMRVKPAMSIKRETDVNLSLRLFNITTSAGDKDSISGYGTYPIQTEFHSEKTQNPIIHNNVEKIEISTNYPNSWEKYFKNALINSGLTYESEFTTEIGNNIISIIFSDPSDICVKVQIINISAEIAPGSIENTR